MINCDDSDSDLRIFNQSGYFRDQGENAFRLNQIPMRASVTSVLLVRFVGRRRIEKNRGCPIERT